MSAKHRTLLELVAILRECEDRRPVPFNLFTALRSAHDEDRLHTRFLAALLNHGRTRSGPRTNLKSFVRLAEDWVKAENKTGKYQGSEWTQGALQEDLDVCSDRSEVKIQDSYMDLVISDPITQRAVVIENKIRASDGCTQLVNYYCKIRKRGQQPFLLYLTLDGRQPPRKSAGELPVTCVSYKDELIPWLEDCQRDAIHEPALRESIGQYIRVVESLTGQEPSEDYMKALRDLLLIGDNLKLAFDLSKAYPHAWAERLKELWKDLDVEIRNEFDDEFKGLLASEEPSEDDLAKFARPIGGSRYINFRYPIRDTPASLCVEFDDRVWYGIHCSKRHHDEEYGRLDDALRHEEDRGRNGWWLWRVCFKQHVDLRTPSSGALALVKQEVKRRQWSKELACDLNELWKRARDAFPQ